MKSDLLQVLSKEKPEHNTDEISEALRRGYSARQIIQALTKNPAMSKTEPRRGKIWYQRGAERFEVPYMYETFMMLCRILEV